MIGSKDTTITYHLPLNTYHLPPTTYPLPLTTYHLQLTLTYDNLPHTTWKTPFNICFAHPGERFNELDIPKGEMVQTDQQTNRHRNCRFTERFLLAIVRATWYVFDTQIHTEKDFLLYFTNIAKRDSLFKIQSLTTFSQPGS